jgi:hypothetical protein
MDIRKFDNSLGIPRSIMPQIPTKLIETFVYRMFLRRSYPIGNIYVKLFGRKKVNIDQLQIITGD